MAAGYHFVTNWSITGTAHQVAEVLGAPTGLARWWPCVYLDVREIKPGDSETRVGRVIDLYTKGWLPYTLRWRFKVTESRRRRFHVDRKSTRLNSSHANISYAV